MDMMFGGSKRYRYLSCTECGAIYQSPMPGIEEIAGFYPQDYSLHQPPERGRPLGGLRRAVYRYRYGYAHLPVSGLFKPLGPLFARMRISGAIPFVQGGRLLDIGCGNGKYLLAMNRLGWQGTGLELSPKAVDICRSAGLNVLQGELQGAAFDSETFDLVTARQLIEHLPAPREFVREVARILKPGGCFALETPNSQALGRGWFGRYWFADEVPRHLVLFHPGNLKRLIEAQGLTLVSQRLDTSPKIVLNSWDYLTRNKRRPSRKRKLRRLLVRPYVALARLLGRGDMILQVYRKR